MIVVMIMFLGLLVFLGFLLWLYRDQPAPKHWELKDPANQWQWEYKTKTRTLNPYPEDDDCEDC